MSNDTPEVKGLRFAKVIVWLIYAYFVLALIILVLAFFLLLFNASTSADFTQWVYRSASRVMEPFRGIFPSSEAENGSVIDFGMIFAMIMYGILALLLHAAVDWIDTKILRQRHELRVAEQQTRYDALQAASSPTESTTGAASLASPPAGAPYGEAQATRTDPPS